MSFYIPGDLLFAKTLFNRILTPVILLIILLLTSRVAVAQMQNNNWYFGNQAAINFSGTIVSPVSGNAGVSIEGCASVSDPVTGNILFYSNGLTIWNRNNDTMLNGTGLLGGINTSATQGVAIVPYPGSVNKYFVFTVDETSAGAVNGFRYSVVDMTLGGGLGGVVVGQKNVLLHSNTTERVATVPNGAGTGYWVIIHERDNNFYQAFRVGVDGIDPMPVTSAAGAVHSTVATANGDGTMGQLKVNNTYTQLAVAIYSQNMVEVLDFDNCTGIVSGAKSIPTLDNPYGIEFSPDGSKLYYSIYYNAGFNGAIYQVDLAASAALSPVLVGLSSSFNLQCVGAMQLAPDNKIYIAINSESWLSAITNPNAAGLSCSFSDQEVLLPNAGLFPRTGLLGLPAKVPALQEMRSLPQIVANDSCAGKDVSFALSAGSGAGNISWNFGDGSQSAEASASGSVTHSFAGPGRYTVTATIPHNCDTDTIKTNLNIINCDTVLSYCNVSVPSAFTPNQDGVNDAIKPIVQCPGARYNFYIYNRWGELVFFSDNNTDRWDGTYKQEKCDMGTYNYLLIYYTNTQNILKGTITLLR